VTPAVKKIRPILAVVLAMSVLAIPGAPTASAWGDEGHRWINLVASERMPADVPTFFQSAGARLSFLGPEPDRWRDGKELYKALSEVNAPDHFIDIDNPQGYAALPNDRYKYADWLRANGKDPKDIGYLPYSILEGYQKLQVLFRLWRDPQQNADRDQIAQNIVYYAGVLGHYVADGSQPLHTTIHYNGWTTSFNPDANTREPLHWRFEGEYVRAKIKPDDFRALVRPARRIDDVFQEIVNYLFESHRLVPELYRMDKAARWDSGNATPEAKKFVAARLAAASQMLANLWYTAWLDSSKGARDSSQ
jgi:hypothetical protein